MSISTVLGSISKAKHSEAELSEEEANVVALFGLGRGVIEPKINGRVNNYI